METWPYQSWYLCPGRKIMKNQLHAQSSIPNPRGQRSVSRIPMCSTWSVSMHENADVVTDRCETRFNKNTTQIFIPVCVSCFPRCAGDILIARGATRFSKPDGRIGRVPGVWHQSEPTSEKNRMVPQCKDETCVVRDKNYIGRLLCAFNRMLSISFYLNRGIEIFVLFCI